MTTYDLGVKRAVKAATLVSTRVYIRYLTYATLAAEVAAFGRIGRSSLKLATDINRAAYIARLFHQQYPCTSLSVKLRLQVTCLSKTEDTPSFATALR